MKKVVLLFGGVSEERLVSVASAQNLAAQYDFSRLIYQNREEELFEVGREELFGHQDVFTREFKPSGKAFAASLEDALSEFREAVIFIALHGTQGENGELQTLLERNRIRFTGPGAKSSAVAFGKNLAKKIILDAGLKTPEEIKFKKSSLETQKGKLEKFLKTHGKIVLKPTESGSSFGLHIVRTPAELGLALQKIADGVYETYIAENFISGRELTVGVMQDGDELIALPASEIILTAGRAFDYEGKYLGEGSTEVTPAQITPGEAEAVQRMALDAHIALGCYGYTRTDLILTAEGPVFLETNTLPGLSKPSFFPQQLLAADIPFKNFIEAQIFLARHRYETEEI